MAQQTCLDSTKGTVRKLYFYDKSVILFSVSCSSGVLNNLFLHDQGVAGVLNGPRQANLVLIAYASSEGSGEPGHLRRLARTFAARSFKH